jgi:putative membrane protein
MKTKHSPYRLSSSLLIAATLGALSPVIAQTTVRDAALPRDGTVELKRVDRDFYEKAAKASMSEVEISRVALARTSNPEVKRFAQMMIDDHESTADELGRLASGKGVSLPAKEMATKWEKHDAKSFDRDYINKMVSDHENVVKLFEKQAKDGHDPEAVAFARKHLATLQHHLQQATDLKRALK